MENGLSASDVALMSRNNDGGFGFGGDGAWIFGLLVLLGLFNGGFGGFGGNRGDRNATVGDVQRATDFAALERQNNEGVAATRQSAYDVMTAIKDGNFNVLGELRDIQTGVNAGFANQQKCCCETLRAIDSVNYNGAINTAAINATTTAQTQKILDAIAGNRMADMQNQINQLQLQAALCGVPRTSPYGYAVVPNFAGYGGCNSGCGVAV